MKPGEQFRLDHEEWLNRDKAVKQDEQPGTWLMDKSGYYFPFKKGDRLCTALGMVCVFLKTTSLVMRANQDEIRSRK